MKRLASNLRSQIQRLVESHSTGLQIIGLVVLLSLVQTASGGFDSDAVGFLHRLVLWLLIVSLIAGQFLFIATGLQRWLFDGRSRWLARGFAFLIVWPLVALEVEGLKRTPLLSYQRPDPLVDFALFMLPGVVFVCGLIVLIETLADRRARRERALRMPPPLPVDAPSSDWPTAPVLSIEAQDHYLEITTERRTHLVRATMKDALGRLRPADGLQVHRSWWVAHKAVAKAERRGRDHVLILKDGRIAPIARGRTEILRDAGWL